MYDQFIIDAFTPTSTKICAAGLLDELMVAEVFVYDSSTHLRGLDSDRYATKRAMNMSEPDWTC